MGWWCLWRGVRNGGRRKVGAEVRVALKIGPLSLGMNVDVVAFDGCDQDVYGKFVLTPVIRTIGDVELGIVGYVGGGDDQ